jgi:ferric-dicitrate binding protein FerR (iron transport regulator)
MGEALFEVSKDRQRPFRVETSHLQVEVLGTRFYMSSYHDEKNISTILEEGSVKLKGNFSNLNQYVMTPGQKAIVDKETMHMKVISDYQIKDSWDNGYLVFEEEKLEQIILKLERKFGLHFIVIDQELKEYTYTGKFKDESVFEILGCLAITKPFKFKLNDNVITMQKE